jgi:Ca2+-transporting ATPase
MLLIFNKKIQCIFYNTELYSFLNFYSVDNLSNITHLVSDKTGTITQNKLIIKKFSFCNQYHDIDQLYFQDTKYCDVEMYNIIKFSVNMVDSDFLTTEDEIISNQTKNLNQNHNYTIIDNYSLFFDNIRKMSSVIIKNHVSNKIFIITKGSIDSIYKKISNKNIMNNDIKLLDKYYPHMRTIAFAIKDITNIYHNNTTTNIIYENNNNYKYVTILCIEDPLQPDLKNIIHFLDKKNIKTSICTGDRKETAFAIANECGIINNIKIIENNNDIVYNPYVFMFSGDTLDKYCTDNKFIKKIHNCETFIGYRLKPVDKKKIIKILREGTSNYVASIGDGNNDIPMFNESHIAISIDKKDNNTVVSNSDIKIRKFKIIKDIMILSEHFNKLNVLASFFTFFKTILFNFSIFLYFSNSYLYAKKSIFPFNFMEIQLFNTVWSVVPIICMNLNKTLVNKLFNTTLNLKKYPIILGMTNSIIIYFLEYNLYTSIVMSLQFYYLIGYNIMNKKSVLIISINCLFFFIINNF